ncbi:MAG: hypothetical protein K2M04_06365 [Muribaculaceae bacterium]|nr:hypothetical protein [Muribaculaceae bacterium]
MKKLLIFAVFIFCVLSAFGKNNARADIFFVNGETLENVELKLPGSWHNKVEYLLDGKKHKVKADSVDHILLYHAEAPERKAYLRWNSIGKFDHKKNEIIDWKAKNWQVLESAGDNLLYWVSFWKVKVGKKDFKFFLGAYEGATLRLIISKSPRILSRSTFLPITIAQVRQGTGWWHIWPTTLKSWSASLKKVISARSRRTYTGTAVMQRFRSTSRISPWTIIRGNNPGMPVNSRQEGLAGSRRRRQ